MSFKFEQNEILIEVDSKAQTLAKKLHTFRKTLKISEEPALYLFSEESES